MRKWIVAAALVAIVGLASWAVFQSRPESIEVGVVLPLSGDLAFTAASHQAALETALAEVNEYLQGGKQEFRLRLQVVDSGGEPERAVEAVNGFLRDGIKVTLGPLSSEELAAVQPLVADSEMLVLSPASSAPALAAPDRVFRLVPSDVWQVKAIIALLRQQGVNVLIPVYRNDAYGQGFVAELQKTGELLVLTGFDYGDEQDSFAEMLSGLDDGINLLVETGIEPAQIAVLTIGFGEVSNLLAEANGYEQLRAIRWLGTDGISQNADLLGLPDALAFAEQVDFTASAFGMDQTVVYTKVLQQINQRYGKKAESRSILSYDLLWLTAQLYEQAGLQTTLPELESKFLELTQLTPGASGWLMLDENGDRKYSQYQFWRVESSEWRAYAKYRRDPGLAGYLVFD